MFQEKNCHLLPASLKRCWPKGAPGNTSSLNAKKDFATNQEKLEHVIEYYGRSNMPYEGVDTI